MEAMNVALSLMKSAKLFRTKTVRVNMGHAAHILRVVRKPVKEKTNERRVLSGVWRGLNTASDAFEVPKHSGYLPQASQKDAMRSDWQKIGNDFRKAYTGYVKKAP